MDKKSIVIECTACGGTGLYRGFMEGKDEAVICARCDGEGKQTLQYSEFTGRKKKAGVNKIRGGSGTILDNPGKSAWMSYEQFEKLIPSTK